MDTRPTFNRLLQKIPAKPDAHRIDSFLIRGSRSLLTVQVFPLEICNQAKVKTGFFSEEKVVWADDNNNTCLARSWWWCCGTSSCCLVPSMNIVEILKALNCGRAVNIMQKQNQFARRPVRRWGGVGQFFGNRTPESRYSFVLFQQLFIRSLEVTFFTRKLKNNLFHAIEF